MYKITKLQDTYAITSGSEVILYGDSEVELRGEVKKMLLDLDMYDDVRKEIVIKIRANIK